MTPTAGFRGAGGRWAIFPGSFAASALAALEDGERRRERTVHWAWLLLKRYGVVFRELLARETAAPSWGELARVYRELEMRSEVRGGRFVAGAWGEQFALEGTVEKLRQVRDKGPTGVWVVLAAADPLNLFGILTEGARVPNSRHAAFVVLDGKLVATREGSEITFHEPQRADFENAMRRALQLDGLHRARLGDETAREAAPIPISAAPSRA